MHEKVKPKQSKTKDKTHGPKSNLVVVQKDDEEREEKRNWREICLCLAIDNAVHEIHFCKICVFSFYYNY